MKYEKPVARNLSELSFAEGICNSGAFVGTCYNTWGLSAGDCTFGQTAGSTCSTGSNPANTCTYGPVGYYSGDCVNGGIAKGG